MLPSGLLPLPFLGLHLPLLHPKPEASASAAAANTLCTDMPPQQKRHSHANPTMGRRHGSPSPICQTGCSCSSLLHANTATHLPHVHGIQPLGQPSTPAHHRLPVRVGHLDCTLHGLPSTHLCCSQAPVHVRHLALLRVVRVWQGAPKLLRLCPRGPRICARRLGRLRQACIGTPKGERAALRLCLGGRGGALSVLL